MLWFIALGAWDQCVSDIESHSARQKMTHPRLIKADTREVLPLKIGVTTIKILVKGRKASAHRAAIIGNSAGHFVIRDLSSTEGIFVNGKKVVARRLAAGDSIRVGAVKFEFHVQDEQPPPLPKPQSRSPEVEVTIESMATPRIANDDFHFCTTTCSECGKAISAGTKICQTCAVPAAEGSPTSLLPPEIDSHGPPDNDPAAVIENGEAEPKAEPPETRPFAPLVDLTSVPPACSEMRNEPPPDGVGPPLAASSAAHAPTFPEESARIIPSPTPSAALRVTADPPLMEELVGLSSHIDRWSVLLAILPWFCSPALGAAGINAAYFRVRAKATRLPIPAWPLIVLVSLWLAWLILSGWGSWLVWGMMLAGLGLVLFRFYRDNKELWEKFDRAVLRTAALRTATFSGLIAALLLPGIGVGWTAHELLDICFAAVEGIPRADLTKYFDEALPAAAPPAPPPSKWRHPQQYLAYMCDPWRLLVGKAEEVRVVARGKLSNSSANNAPMRLSNAALSAHHFLHFIWWLLIAQASYVATRLYLYVFARVFVGRGGRVVMQLDSTP